MKFFKIFLVLLVPLLLLASILILTTGAASYKVYVIHTGSMSPNIPSGSAVLVHEGHYRIGQVVTYTEQGLTVTHRLVSINSKGLITTKGDANPTNDPWHIPKSQIIGGVVVAPRYVGYWIMYFKNPLGLLSALLAVLVVWQVWSFTEEKLSNADPTERPPRKRVLAVFRGRQLGEVAAASESTPALEEVTTRSRYAEMFGDPKSIKETVSRKNVD